MTRERIKFYLSMIIQSLLSIDDPVECEGIIYASLCILKEECGEHFEKALIFLLKEGIKA